MMVCICNPKAGRQSGRCLRLALGWMERGLERQIHLKELTCILMEIGYAVQEPKAPRRGQRQSTGNRELYIQAKAVIHTLLFSFSRKAQLSASRLSNYSLTKNKMMLPVVKGEILSIERSEWVFYSVFPGSCHHQKELRDVHVSRQGHIAEDFRF